MATLARQAGVELYRLEHPAAPGYQRAIWSHGRVLFHVPAAPRWRVQSVGPVGQATRALEKMVRLGWRLVAVWEGHGKRAVVLAGRERCRRCGHRQAHHRRGVCAPPLGCWCHPGVGKNN